MAHKIYICFLIIIQYSKIMCQVCVETIMSYHDVPETYLYTYLEAYERSDCLFWCTDTRVATAMGTRTVRKLIPKQINVCCEGYIHDENEQHNGIHCKPVCSPDCVNGYCKSPGVCACDTGYIPDVFNSNHCVPLCINGCDHGTCTAPNTCECDQGYDLNDDICKPVCSDPCHNGTCVAPETCQCLPGFKKSENLICEPFCSDTESGECIDTIICEPGWTKVFTEGLEICEPICTKSCINSICVAPETCECLDGYDKSENYICEPYCSSECLHGSCVSPETCVCEPGWYQREFRGKCLAHCDHSCGNGTCVYPNVCECYHGYKIDEFKYQNENIATCVPECVNCEGSCIAPGICACEWPEETVLVTIDGRPCDCVENCSEDANKCERTVCLITTTTTEAFSNPVSFSKELESTTIENNINTTNISIDEIVTEPINIDTSDDDVKDENNDPRIEQLQINKASWLNSKWFYASGSIVVAVIIVLVAAVLKRKYSTHILNRNISDNSVLSAVHYEKKNCA